MKIVPKAQNLIEWIALKANLYPLPTMDSGLRDVGEN
jgi:hypothetical protein